MLVYVLGFVLLVVVIKLYVAIKHTNYCRSKVCLEGKTALVTGGNTGIGYQIVVALAQRGCRVILADRTEHPDLLENIYKETRSKKIVFKYVDLASFNSVRKLAADVVRDEERLDILIHNAGMANDVKVTEDGLDILLQVNYFSSFLLTHLVLDLLKKTGGRIIFTSSVASYIHNFSIEKLKLANESSIYRLHYPHAKLCSLVVANMFAEKLKNYGITSNTYHPGLAYTNIFGTKYYKGGILDWVSINSLRWVTCLIGKSPEEGAQTAIYLACANELENVTAEFFFNSKPTYKPRLVHDKKLCQTIWETTEELVKLKEHEKI